MAELGGVADNLGSVAEQAAARSGEPDVASAVRVVLIDWFAAAIGGSATASVGALRTALGSHEDGPARLVGEGSKRLSMPTAAFINGTAAHTLEVDDIYAPGFYHPSAPAVAAALAVADAHDLSGAELVASVAAGIEIGCRVAADLGAEHYRLWHTTGTAGSIGAAAAASIALGASHAQTVGAITLSATMTGGLQQTFRRDGHGKPMHAGHAAQTGVISALAARGGLFGAWDALEGEAGLARATGVRTTWTASRSPGCARPHVQQLSFKPYPCCGHAFAVVDAVLELRARGIRSGDVRELTVGTYRVATETANIAEPTSPTEARFSIPFIARSALRAGVVNEASFASEYLSELASSTAAPAVSVVVDAELDAAAPAQRGARVTATLRDGTRSTATIPNRLGSPENPISAQALEAKYLALVEPVLGAERAGALLGSLQRVDVLRSVSELTPNRGER